MPARSLEPIVFPTPAPTPQATAVPAAELANLTTAAQIERLAVPVRDLRDLTAG